MGTVSVWALGLVSAVWLDLGWVRAVGLGAVSLRALGIS